MHRRYQTRALVSVAACLATTLAFGSEATARRAHLHAQGVEQPALGGVRAAPRTERVRLVVREPSDAPNPLDPPTPADPLAAPDPTTLLVAAAGDPGASLHTARAVLVFLAEALPATSPDRAALARSLDELQRRAPRGPEVVA